MSAPMTSIYWDITDRCNARCAYCWAARDLRGCAGRELSTSSVIAGLRHLRAAGAASVVFLGGEPTLREDLAQITGIAQRMGLPVGIATNGLRLTERLRRALLEQTSLAINISLDSIHAEENDALRGSGYHDVCMRHLRSLLAERSATGSRVRVTIQMTLTQVNLARLRSSLESFLDLGVDSVVVDRMKALSWHPEAVRAAAPRPRDWIRAAGELARLAAGLRDPLRLRLNYGLVRLKAALAERCGYPVELQRTCPGGLEIAVVDFAGNLHPCRLAPLRPPAGYEIAPVNIRSPEAGDFLQHPYFTGFFNFAHTAAVYEGLTLCRDCPHYLVCEPCPLDVVACGDRVLAECRLLDEGVDL